MKVANLVNNKTAKTSESPLVMYNVLATSTSPLLHMGDDKF
jgi:hypothetical protein